VKYICLYFTYMGSRPYSQPIIVTIFGGFSDLADVINCAKFQNDRLRGFCPVGA
jgi:hypothetical protein